MRVAGAVCDEVVDDKGKVVRCLAVEVYLRCFLGNLSEVILVAYFLSV